MSRHWLDSIRIAGGFLSGLSLQFPPSLTCVIGPRGSGKSTLAEALRYCLRGHERVSKKREALIAGNLAAAVVTIRTASERPGECFEVRRSYRQPAALATAEGSAVTSVDLDRGTFLPLDAFDGDEIEAIADESLGERRRALLDDLRPEEFRQIHVSVLERKRALDANADRIRALRARISDVIEQIEELGTAQATLAALSAPETEDEKASSALVEASRQQQANEQETDNLRRVLRELAQYKSAVQEASERLESRTEADVVVQGSSNTELLSNAERTLRSTVERAREHASMVAENVSQAEDALNDLQRLVADVHNEQNAEFTRLQQEDHELGELIRRRQSAQRDVDRLEALRNERRRAEDELRQLADHRQHIKGEYLLEREQISHLRADLAGSLEQQAGESVRVRILTNADSLSYQQLLAESLRGAGVRNQPQIVAALMRVRPEDLAQMIQSNDLDEFERQLSLGAEREDRPDVLGDDGNRRRDSDRTQCRTTRRAKLQGCC